MKIRRPGTLLFALAIPQIAGIVGSIASMPAIDMWYATLEKPFLTPPNWVFGPVWFVLYLLMGVSWYLVLKKGWHRERVRTASFLFIVQLVLNSIWSYLFFGLQLPAYALVDIIFILPLIGFTAHVFEEVDHRAGLLLIPYFLWVSFATYLNAAIWLLN